MVNFRRPAPQRELTPLDYDCIDAVNRLAASITRGLPFDLSATAAEWSRHLEQFPGLNLDELVLTIAATRTWWPAIAEVINVIGEMTLDPRRTEEDCEDGWVQVDGWPGNSFRPCPIHTDAGALQKWAANDRRWIDGA